MITARLRPGLYGNCKSRHFDTENLHIFVVKSHSVINLCAVPLLKVDYHINLFLQLDSTHTEKFSGIDNSYTSKLNEVTDIFGRLAIECSLGSFF